jgi:hypothetical protein
MLYQVRHRNFVVEEGSRLTNRLDGADADLVIGVLEKRPQVCRGQ